METWWDGQRRRAEKEIYKDKTGIKDSNCEMETDKNYGDRKKRWRCIKLGSSISREFKSKSIVMMQTSYSKLFILCALICESLTKGHIGNAL